MASTRAPSSPDEPAVPPPTVRERRRGTALSAPVPTPSPWSGRSMQLISVLAVAGGLLGMVNLFVPGVLKPGLPSVAYAVTMLTLVVGGLVLFVGGERAAWLVPVFVLAADVVYVVVAVSVVDASLYATPLMLLFSTLASGALLGPRLLGVHCVVVVPAIAVALSAAYPDPTALAVQVVVHAVVLDLTALAIFVLRRRSERLLEQTRMLSTIDPLTGLPNRRHVAERASAPAGRRPPLRPVGGCAPHRHRPLQGGQRHLRARHRRRGAVRDGRERAQRAPRGRRRRPDRRRGDAGAGVVARPP